MYGFVFRIFWLAGGLRLNSRLRVPDHWESWKTEAERQELIQVMRQTEVNRPETPSYVLQAFLKAKSK
ncbi:hypothetical protein SCP_1101710 [Sparassis crispa]|uniref:Uncharacterized protein n=1 Tax=Sparassis crispa TaxID=139825 RepID=A0A401GZA7_9APHY|nr:hypothetical protein SCP_1101710 [Sparassis crispa]GBE87494.1 hypothetical protein SCP_1101710 [Sparassis crispa]